MDADPADALLPLSLVDSSGGWKSIEKATDGSLTDGNAHKKGTSEYITYDLGRDYTLTRARIHEDNAGGWNVETWQVQYWDGAAWAEVFPETDTPVAGWNEVDFPNITTSQVRLVVNDQKHVELREFELYGYARPNFIVIFTDDQGYADVGVYGSGTAPEGEPWNDWDRIPISTPRLDQMAAEGVRFTSFYSGSPTCTRSRAGLLTGSYPKRVGFNNGVLFPDDTTGLNPNEITMADLLRARGYATAAFGKWHLGHKDAFLPTSNGFDEYYGIPYSNDMKMDRSMTFADDALFRDGWTLEDVQGSRKFNAGDVPLMRGTEVIEFPADQSTLSLRYTDEAIRFVEQHKHESFFIYLPFTMPHVPLFSSPMFDGTSARGAYGDTIEEIDYHVGRLLDALQEQGVDDNTLVVFTSDNGPWLKYNDEGGTAYPLRDGKSTSWEGGMRVPAIFRWPGKIPANEVRDEPAILMDLYTTFAKLSDGDVPTGRITDGEDIWPIITGEPGAAHGPIYYDLSAIREGDWKYRKRALYNLATDIHEDVDVSEANSAIRKELKNKLSAFKNNVNATIRPIGDETTVVLPAGCMDPEARNYDAAAVLDDGSCGVL